MDLRTRTAFFAASAVLAALAPTTVPAGASPVPEPAPAAPTTPPSVDVDRAFALHLAEAPS